MKVWTVIQVICDLVSSKDGRLNGTKRTAGSQQFVQVFMTNPDMVYMDKYPEPRFGPMALRVMAEAVFKEQYGYEMNIQQFGKPTKATYDFAEEMARE